MTEALDAFQYLGYLKSRWRFLALACAVAVAGSLALTLLLPRRYTATARILIEPPAGVDARSSLVVSPIYFESLKTYEHFASSDSLFLRAMDHFHLRRLYHGGPVESIKKSVLQVEIPRNTKILEIEATLPDSKLAQAMAQYIAEETVKLNRSVVLDDAGHSDEALEKQKAAARAELDKAEAAMGRFAAERPGVEALAADVESRSELRDTLSRMLIAAEVDAGSGPAGFRSADEVRQEARERRDLLRGRLSAIEDELRASQQVLAGRKARLARLRADLQSAREAFSRADGRLSEARAAAGYRGEQLKIIDPGIVPERPSSPNLPLNVGAAGFLAVLFSTVYLSLKFGSRSVRTPALKQVPFRAIGSGRDD